MVFVSAAMISLVPDVSANPPLALSALNQEKLQLVVGAAPVRVVGVTVPARNTEDSTVTYVQLLKPVDLYTLAMTSPRVWPVCLKFVKTP